MKEIIKDLTEKQKEILRNALEPGSIILFNIKGMIQVLHRDGPFYFVEMGYEDIDVLRKKGLIQTKRGKEESNVLQGEEYILSSLGKEIAQALKASP